MANITRYDPFGDLFDDIFSGFVVGPVGFEAANPVRRMKVDVAEQNGEYKVLAELPGVKKDDIKVNIDGDQVSAMRRTASACCTASATSARSRALSGWTRRSTRSAPAPSTPMACSS